MCEYVHVNLYKYGKGMEKEIVRAVNNGYFKSLKTKEVVGRLTFSLSNTSSEMLKF